MKNILNWGVRAFFCLILMAISTEFSFAQNSPNHKKPSKTEKTSKSQPKKKSTGSPAPKSSTAKPRVNEKPKGTQKKKHVPAKPEELYTQHILKINPAAFLWCTGDVGFEKVLSPHVSLQLNGSITRERGDVFDGLTATFTGYSIGPEIRYYWMPFSKMLAPQKKGALPSIAAPFSFYTSLSGRMANYRAYLVFPDHPDEKAEFFERRSYSTHLRFGSQFWLKRKKKPILICDLSLGGGWATSNTQTRLSEQGKMIKLKTNGFVPSLGCRIGVPIKKKIKK